MGHLVVPPRHAFPMGAASNRAKCSGLRFTFWRVDDSDQLDQPPDGRLGPFF